MLKANWASEGFDRLLAPRFAVGCDYLWRLVCVSRLENERLKENTYLNKLKPQKIKWKEDANTFFYYIRNVESTRYEGQVLPGIDWVFVPFEGNFNTGSKRKAGMEPLGVARTKIQKVDQWPPRNVKLDGSDSTGSH